VSPARVGLFILLAIAASGCGARPHMGLPAATRMPLTPGAVRREVVRSRRGATDLVRLEAEISEAGEVTLRGAVHEHAGRAIRSLPADARAQVAQRPRSGTGPLMPDLDDALTFALGTELAMAVALAPFGASGLEREEEGSTTLALGVPEDSALPSTVPVRCARATPDALRCEGTLLRAVEVDSAAAEQGIRAGLQGSVVLEVERDATGLRRCDLALVFDVVTRFGSLEEHDAGEVHATTARAR
jgi:hypothetical protein